MKIIASVMLLLWTVMSLHADPNPVPGGETMEYSQAELDQMLAPIALYPDSLLAQILIGATYPLEIVQAARWTRAHKHLQGESAMQAVESKGWDPAVQALVAFPDTLSRMSDNLDWTQKLGEAFLLQEEAVMDTIQGLRQRAHAAGTLEQLEYVRVQRTREVIVIEPLDPEVIYVPYYPPTVVYGSWWWPAYPPVYWSFSTTYSAGGSVFFWGSGVRVGSGFNYCRWDWPARQITIVNVNVYPQRHRYHNHYDSQRYAHQGHSQRWQHSPEHRRGVAYRHQRLNHEYRRSVRQERERRYARSEHLAEASGGSTRINRRAEQRTFNQERSELQGPSRRDTLRHDIADERAQQRRYRSEWTRKSDATSLERQQRIESELRNRHRQRTAASDREGAGNDSYRRRSSTAATSHYREDQRRTEFRHDSQRQRDGRQSFNRGGRSASSTSESSSYERRARPSSESRAVERRTFSAQRRSGEERRSAVDRSGGARQERAQQGRRGHRSEQSRE